MLSGCFAFWGLFTGPKPHRGRVPVHPTIKTSRLVGVRTRERKIAVQVSNLSPVQFAGSKTK